MDARKRNLKLPIVVALILTPAALASCKDWTALQNLKMSWTSSCLHKIWGDLKLQSWGLEEMALKPSSVRWRHVEASCRDDAERNCFAVCRSCGVLRTELQMLPQLRGCVLLSFSISFKAQESRSWSPASCACHCFPCRVEMDWLPKNFSLRGRYRSRFF